MIIGLATSNASCMEGDPINLKSGSKDEHFTPLHMAIYGRDYEMVEFLIKERANVNAVDGNDTSCIDLALIRRTVCIAKRLATSNATLSSDMLEQRHATSKKTVLHDTARQSGAAQSVKWLCEMGADLNATTSEGRLPIHEAVLSKDKANVEVILGAMRKEQKENKITSIEVIL
jgi:ankyrin repeat protein